MSYKQDVVEYLERSWKFYCPEISAKKIDYIPSFEFSGPIIGVQTETQRFVKEFPFGEVTVLTIEDWFKSLHDTDAEYRRLVEWAEIPQGVLPI